MLIHTCVNHTNLSSAHAHDVLVAIMLPETLGYIGLWDGNRPLPVMPEITLTESNTITYTVSNYKCYPFIMIVKIVHNEWYVF